MSKEQTLTTFLAPFIERIIAIIEKQLENRYKIEIEMPLSMSVLAKRYSISVTKLNTLRATGQLKCYYNGTWRAKPKDLIKCLENEEKQN